MDTWRSIVEALREQVAGHEKSIVTLREDMASMRGELHAERAHGAALLAYVRRVLTWAMAILPSGNPPPPPPPDIEHELADLWRDS